MKYSSQYSNVRGMFWDGTDKGKQYKLDREGITFALRRALKDYTSRTSAKKDSEQVASVENMANALPEFIERMEQYFNEPPKATAEDYDRWHTDMCNLFIQCITGAKIRETVAYGKAQKIVNMTMKTIYCLDGAQEKDEYHYFDYCHMPLDSIILEWFRRYVADQWYNPNKRQKEKISISQEGGKLPKWSSLAFMPNSLKLTFEDYEKCPEFRCYNNKYHYMFFVSVIREYFQKGNTANRHDGLTPLQGEFYIWQEIQMEVAAEALYGLDIEREKTIEAAEKKWSKEWNDSKLSGQTSDQQFKWCKKMFKKLSIEDKILFLQNRVAHLCNYVNMREST